jgi:hypothetical protein
MKLYARAISALLIVAFLTAPSLLAAQALQAPVDRSVFPGVTTIQYANQTLVFTTAVPLRVKLQVLASGIVELRFKAQQTRSTTGGNQSSAGGQTVIFWEQAGEDIFNGSASGDWTDIPLTEGGWTEK